MPLRAATRRSRSTISRCSRIGDVALHIGGLDFAVIDTVGADLAFLQVEQDQVHEGETGLAIGGQHRLARAFDRLAIGIQPPGAELRVAIGIDRGGALVGFGDRAAGEVGRAATGEGQQSRQNKRNTFTGNFSHLPSLAEGGRA